MAVSTMEVQSKELSIVMQDQSLKIQEPSPELIQKIRHQETMTSGLDLVTELNGKSKSQEPKSVSPRRKLRWRHNKELNKGKLTTSANAPDHQTARGTIRFQHQELHTRGHRGASDPTLTKLTEVI